MARTVEHEVFPVRRDVERAQITAIIELGEPTGRLLHEIEQPEVLGFHAWQVDEARTAGQETVRSTRADPHGRQHDGSAIRFDAAEQVLTTGSSERRGNGIHDQVVVRGPDGIVRLAFDEPHGLTAVYRDLEQALILPVAATRDDPLAVWRPVSGSSLSPALNVDRRRQGS